jgi:SAM-dependent methyltransferase
MLDRAMPGRGHLVDLPCGTGYLSVRAMQGGWRVTPSDYRPEVWQGPPDLRVTYADLHTQLPFGSNTFDALACCEGLEHIENPWLALREFYRVVRPGGSMVVSIPNTIDMRQRRRLLFRGFYGNYFPVDQHHINLMGPLVLCHAMLRIGYLIRDIGAVDIYGGPFHRLISPLFRISRKSLLPDEVRKMLSRSDVLIGRTVLILAEVGDKQNG